VWTKINVSNSGTHDVPAARTGSACAIVNNEEIYVFGGFDREQGWLNDMFKFNTLNNTWTKLEKASGSPPSPRDKLSCCVIGKKIYFFGGFGPQSPPNDEEEDEDEDQQPITFGWFNDLHIFDTESFSWSKIDTHGTQPSPRAAFGMAVVSSPDNNSTQRIVVIGGRDTSQRVYDIHILEVASLTWFQPLLVRGTVPQPRSFHTCTAVSNNKIILFGGLSRQNIHFNDVHVLDTDSMMWLSTGVEGFAGPRGFHAAAVVGKNFYIFGGSADFDPLLQENKKYLNDLRSMDTTLILDAKVSM